MDFIKTSSLRALIELTFQRNWNGLIWMSRKGVTTKRVKTALSRISAQPRSPAGRGTNVPRSAKSSSVRLKSRPKSKPSAARITTRETLPAVGHATTLTPRRARSARAGKTPRGRATRLAYHGRTPVRAGKLRPASGRDFIGQSSSVRPSNRTTATTRSSGRSSRPTVPTPRSTRSPF
ncbi:unnamed protein product [Microthlaspi erraticum]|uniref:Uncharacterized protein n=1 Tax=Microthlaspi erraticum TaxID=1685480 RepID=A0A6D2I024_9BRAS|nr:unnamed protein product [Microthlaspi erraticum]